MENSKNIPDLSKYRDEIDRIDSEIVALLNRRYTVVRKIGECKREHGLPVFVPERERLLLARLHSLNGGPMSRTTLESIYREIIAGARHLEQPLRCACLGPEGTYTLQAARQRFGHGAEFPVVPTLPDVFREVEAERVECGCVPVENSTEGVVNPTLDALIRGRVRIISELELPIHHQLLSHSPLHEIRCVYSHVQALSQCREFLLRELPDAQLIEVSSTARAAELAACDTGVAALAGMSAAIERGLPVVKSNVEDDPTNTTRFLIVGTQSVAPTGDDKTSIGFSLNDRAGALADALEPFRKAGISMTMIVSRPLKTESWAYCFFVDLAGHIEDEPVRRACEELAAKCSFFKMLGSYPRYRN